MLNRIVRLKIGVDAPGVLAAILPWIRLLVLLNIPNDSFCKYALKVFQVVILLPVRHQGSDETKSQVGKPTIIPSESRVGIPSPSYRGHSML